MVFVAAAVKSKYTLHGEFVTLYFADEGPVEIATFSCQGTARANKWGSATALHILARAGV